MTLPPLANLFAVHDPDRAVLDALAADLATSCEFQEVWRPAQGWIAAAAPLPGGRFDGRRERQRGLAFAEGRDAVGAPLAYVAELADCIPETLASLPGDFGFVRFRPGGGATVARSAGGLVPFYLRCLGRRIAIGSRLGDFVRFLADEPRLDPLVNAVWTTGHGLFPDGRTFLAGVSILERGWFARLEPGRSITKGRYWNPRPHAVPRPTPAQAREHAERLRALLVQKLEQDLDPAGGNLLTLSGGVDSSSLGALGAGVVGRPVCTWSLLPEPDDLYRREMSYIAPLAERFGFERRWEVRLRAETRVQLLRAAPKTVFPVIHPALCDLPRVLEEAPIRVLFGGEFADEVCGSVFTLPDWAAHTSLARLLANLHRLPTGRRDALRWAKHRWLGLRGRPVLPFPETLPAFVRTEVAEEYSEWLERRRVAAAREGAALRHFTMRTEADGFVAMNWEAASALGVRRSFPFFNREVLELAFECHPTELIGPGTKKLLRRALRSDVPARNLHRADKGHWGSYLKDARLSWTGSLPQALESIVRSEYCPQPPPMLDLWDAHRLTQLTVVTESLHLRRATRRSTVERRLAMSQSSTPEKKPYDTPALTNVGNVEEITQGSAGPLPDVLGGS